MNPVTPSGNISVKTANLRAIGLPASSGASSDLSVWSDLGTLTNRLGNARFSDQTASIIDEETQKLLREADERAYELLKDNRDKLELLVESLLQREELHKEEIEQILTTGKPLDNGKPTEEGAPIAGAPVAGTKDLPD